eukprot:1182551-Prorocentrum_minimum.AAC.1
MEVINALTVAKVPTTQLPPLARLPRVSRSLPRQNEREAPSLYCCLAVSRRAVPRVVMRRVVAPRLSCALRPAC